MGPVTILGVAANVLQFVDFGLKFLSKSKQIGRDGSLEENAHIEVITTHLRETFTRLNGLSPPASSYARTLQTRCLSIIENLLKCLEAVTISGSPTRWKGFRAAVKSIRSKEKIQDWVNQLEDIRNKYNLKLRG
jgi:hypothetical protein